METIYIDMKKERRADDIRLAGEILKAGGLVAFPTETVYGLGANALDADASAKIYAAKGRPSDNPLIVHIADWEALNRIVKEIPPMAEPLAKAFWPGPLTMIFKKSDLVPETTTGGLDTVAVRMPDHEIARDLIRAGGGYIAAPSANTSGRPSPTTAAHVAEDMMGRIDMILDGGEVGIGIESTIVDLTEEIPMILRPGFVNAQMLKSVTGEITMDRAVSGEDTTARPKAPGMRYRHYAPKAELIIVEGETDQVQKKINELTADVQKQGKKAGIIATEESLHQYPCGSVKCIGTRQDEITISRHLFAVLRSFDEEDVSVIYSEAFDTPNMGQAIMNRLIKAAGHQIIRV